VNNNIQLDTMKTLLKVILLILRAIPSLFAQQTTNKPECEQQFMDMGFGMFIHWSMDSQVGAVISHSMA